MTEPVDLHADLKLQHDARDLQVTESVEMKDLHRIIGNDHPILREIDLLEEVKMDVAAVVDHFHPPLVDVKEEGHRQTGKMIGIDL